MKRHILALLMLAASMSAHATNYQDVWWDTSKGGEGVTISQQGNTLFVAFYGYNTSGSATWLLTQGTLAGNSMSAPIYAYTGTPLTQPYNPSQGSSQVVGNATLTLNSPTSATLAFTAFGASVNLNLVRYNFSSFIPDGTYLGEVVETRTGCSSSSNNGTYSVSENFGVTTSGSQITILTQDFGSSCTYSGSWSQQGSKAIGSGSFNCSNGSAGNWNFNDITVNDYSVVFVGTGSISQGETCSIALRLGGIK